MNLMIVVGNFRFLDQLMVRLTGGVNRGIGGLNIQVSVAVNLIGLCRFFLLLQHVGRLFSLQNEQLIKVMFSIEFYTFLLVLALAVAVEGSSLILNPFDFKLNELLSGGLQWGFFWNVDDLLVLRFIFYLCVTNMIRQILFYFRAPLLLTDGLDNIITMVCVFLKVIYIYQED